MFYLIFKYIRRGHSEAEYDIWENIHINYAWPIIISGHLIYLKNKPDKINLSHEELQKLL